MLYLGVDPGASGAIAALNDNGSIFRVDKIPPTDAELFALLQLLEGSHPRVFAVLEGVHAFPKMGAVSAFTFGRGFGALQMALHAAAISFDVVTPRKWQGALSCLSGRDKNVTKRRAQQLFPTTTITHAIADALLMAEYCRRLKTGQLTANPVAK